MVCRSGSRSLRAAGFLVNHGYTNVVNMEHGMIRWVQKGFPTKGDISSMSGTTQSSVCCDTNDTSLESCGTPTNKKQKVNMSDLGNSCDCSEPGCC